MMMDLSDMMMDLRELVKNSIIRLQIDTKNLFKLVGTGFELVLNWIEVDWTCSN